MTEKLWIFPAADGAELAVVGILVEFDEDVVADREGVGQEDEDVVACG